MRYLKYILDGALVTAFVVMMVAITLQVLFRYVIQNPLFGSEEIGRLALVWVTFLGAALATRDNTHLRIDFFEQRLPPRWRLLAEATSDIGTLVFSILLVWFGTGLARFSLVFESAALRFPMTLFHAAVPVSALLMAMYSSRQLWKKVQTLRSMS